jgi:hypothetical protein
MRVCFLFNHDQIHQIAHSLPVALALARASADSEIIIATTNDRAANEVMRRIGTTHPANISFVHLTLISRLSRGIAKVFGRVAPAAKALVLGDNLDFFRALDVLVVTERTSLILKTRYGLTWPKMILIDHGAGDRAIGFGKTTALFDHILAAGPKISERLIREAGVAPERLTITGYPKFDAPPKKRVSLPFAHPDRPTILYNPHLSPHLSSWYRQGRAVLDFFLDSPDFNLIFAPHIMLFERPVVFAIDTLSIGFPGQLDPKYAAAPNIFIDPGSIASTDMTYTDAADLYLGDVSSQVYEFLRKPRPCVFLNSHRVKYEGDPNYAHWQAGPVIERTAELKQALDESIRKHGSHYRAIQQQLFDHSFDITQELSAERAARAIIMVQSDGDPTVQGISHS